MPDGMGPDFLARSMFFREAEGGPSGQELQSMAAPFGGSPEQAMAFLQSPGAQKMLQHFGLGGFDPNQIRQSPFLPNSFMQHHPMLGRGLSSAMANVAATPEAPLVSGAGSGISRAMQGIGGGNEMQRQYQVRQLMAPFQAMGMQMPAMAEGRRQQLLEALMQDMHNREGLGAQEEERKRAHDLAQAQQRDQHTLATRPYTDAAGHTWTYQEPQAAQPQQAPHPDAGPQGGPMLGGMGSIMSPGAPAQAAQPGGFQPAKSSQQPSIEDIAARVRAEHPERQALADYRKAFTDAGYQDAEADYYSQRAYEAHQKGNAAGNNSGGKSKEQWDKEYRKMDDGYTEKIRALEVAMTGKDVTPEQKTLYQQQIDMLNGQRESEKAEMDRDRGQPDSSIPYRPEKRYKDPNAKAAPQINPQAAPAQAPPAQATPQQPNPQAIW